MLEQFLNIYAIATCVLGLMICMHFYMDDPKRDYEYGIMILLCNLLSNYYWGAYVLLIGSDPNVSSFSAYFGWNISYIPMMLILTNRLKGEEKRFFSPLCLIPVPINIAQFILYLQFGGLFNNIWEGLWCTAIACAGLNGLIYYWKNRKNNVTFPYECLFCFAYMFFEYGMWTGSSFEWPGEWSDPFTYFSILLYSLYLFIPFAIRKETGRARKENKEDVFMHLGSVIRPFYTVVVFLCLVGGYVLAAWMKSALDQGMVSPDDYDTYRIIAVMLFVFTVVLLLFSIGIIVIVRFARRAAESDELRRAKAIADHSNAAKSDFLANMSHEIRTPINAVLGMNEMILRESLQSRDDPPGDKNKARDIFANICNYAGNIESAGTNLLSIINDILDFSKIEAGKLEIVEGEYRLSSVLNDLCNVISFKARDKGLEFSIDVDASLPDGLYGDEVRFRQVVTNILNNAVKYTKEGSVHMSVRGEWAAQLNGREAVYLVIKVKDTGIGIKEEDIDKLFTKFERMDLETNSTVEGTGLGLAITRSLLTMMGGSISVESVYGQGSEFTVTLPQTVLSDESVGDFKSKYEQSMLERKAYEESFRAPAACILIVDDTKMNLTVAKGLLKSTAVSIDTAISGMQSIKMAAEKKYDIILMDQRMPEMDGTTAMHRILEDKSGPNIDTPFICLTADAVSGARDRYMAQGFTDYLTKPIDSKALESMLIKYLPKDKILPGVGSGSDGDISPDAGIKDMTSETGINDHGSDKTHPGSAGRYEKLTAEGVDTAAGLMYCQNDDGFYMTILKEYSESAGEKTENLQKFFEEKNWKDYSVLVHSIKSTSKMIGAIDLFTMAAELEAASDKEDESILSDKHPALTERYKAVAEAALQEAGRYEDEGRSDGNTQKSDISDGDDEVLEFMPD